MFAPRENETVFEYWLSFSPAAPLFGVQWRFAETTRAWPTPFALAPGLAATPAAAQPEAPVDVSPAAPPMDESDDPVADAEVEQVAAAPEMDAGIASAETGRPATLYDTAPAEPDDLKKIRGVGQKLEALLNELGVYTFEQIAGFDDANLAWIDANLETFKGRPFRDDWIAQARDLLKD